MHNINNNIGSLKISEKVIATIASFAAKEVIGVASIGLNKDDNIIKNLFIRQSPSTKSVRTQLNDGIAVIDIYVNLKYGSKIPKTSFEIQEKVKESIQNMTGITVSRVNVHVEGIIFEEGLLN